MYLTNADFDALLREDVPYFDLTSYAAAPRMRKTLCGLF